MVVEEDYVLVEYSSRHGGSRKKHEKYHFYPHVEAIMVAHKQPADDNKTFTVNPRVTFADPFGTKSGGKVPECWQKMGGGAEDKLVYRQGGPVGGPVNSFPPRILTTFVNR